MISFIYTAVLAAHQHLDLLVIGLGLREGVVERDVDGVVERFVGVDLGHQDAVAEGVEHRRDAGEHDVVVVDQSDENR